MSPTDELMARDVLGQDAPAPRVRQPDWWVRAALVVDLARTQGRRMLRQPAYLIALVWVVLGVGLGLPDTPYEKYSGVTGLLVFYLGPLAFFAANLVASSERRSGADEWTPALPMTPARRTTALLLACLLPAGVTLGLDLVLFSVVGQPDVILPVHLSHLASVPLLVLGAAVLGVAVARLLPWPGAALLVMVGLVAANLWTSSRQPYLGLYVDFADWTDTDAVPGLLPGSGPWHLAYLAGLVGLAACGAFLRDVRRPWIPVLGGAACGVLVLVAGVAQLP